MAGYVFGVCSCHCELPCESVNCITLEWDLEFLIPFGETGYVAGVDTWVAVSGSATIFCDGTPTYRRTCKDGVPADDAPNRTTEFYEFVHDPGDIWTPSYGWGLGNCDCLAGMDLYISSLWTDCDLNPIAPSFNWSAFDGSYQEVAYDVWMVEADECQNRVIIRGSVLKTDRRADDQEDCGCP